MFLEDQIIKFVLIFITQMGLVFIHLIELLLDMAILHRGKSGLLETLMEMVKTRSLMSGIITVML